MEECESYRTRRALESVVSSAVNEALSELELTTKDVSEVLGTPLRFLDKVASGRFFLPRYEFRGKALPRLYVLLQALGLGNAPFVEDIRKNYPSWSQPYPIPIKPAEDNFPLLTPNDKRKVDIMVQRIVNSYGTVPNK